MQTLAASLAELEQLRSDIAARDGQTAEMEKRLSEAMQEIVNLEMKIESGSLGDGDNTRKAIAATEAANEALTKRLAALEDEYAALRAENAELHRVAGTDWETMRSENSVLRDRLAGFAAEVLRMAETKPDGPASPPLDGDAGAPPADWQSAAGETAPADEPEPVESTPPADRPRALQGIASRH